MLMMLAAAMVARAGPSAFTQDWMAVAVAR